MNHFDGTAEIANAVSAGWSSRSKSWTSLSSFDRRWRGFSLADAVERLSAAAATQGRSDPRFRSRSREKLLEQADREAGAGQEATAQQLYDALPVSDQAQMREFYLTTLEAVDLPLREKYNKLYRYY